MGASHNLMRSHSVVGDLAAERRQHVAPSVSWGTIRQGEKSLEEATGNSANDRNLLSPLRGLTFSFSVFPTADAGG